MKKIICCSLVLFFGLCGPAIAQVSIRTTQSLVSPPAAAAGANSITADIRSQDKGRMETKSGRVYLFEDGTVIEVVSLEGAEIRIYNIYDFENQLVYHKANANSLGMSVTPFSAAGGNIGKIKQYGCFLTRQSTGSGVRPDTPQAIFFEKNCK